MIPNKPIKKAIVSILILIVCLAVWQYELLFYGISQGLGQMKIIMNTRPVEEVLHDSTFPDSLKYKIRLVQEIRKYAFDSLGLNYNENYTTIYDQGNKPILWIITACEPFQLKAKEWKFPLLGSFSYKGFFNLQRAQKEEKQLREEGYDTSIDEVGGWSTLGWFKDPILSNMLSRSDGQLANLIIHELTHGTLYVKDNVDFNENLASFVGDKGAQKFLGYKFGKASQEYLSYAKSRVSAKNYTRLVLRYAQKFDSLYETISTLKSYNHKKEAKERLFGEFKSELQVFIEGNGKRKYRKAQDDQLNNTYFMDVKRYRENLEEFEKEFATNFNSDFSRYLQYLKNKYPSL